MDSINEFESYITSLENEYTIELSSIFKFRRYLFSIVLPDFESRLKNQIVYVRELFRKEVDALFKEKFFSLNIVPDDKVERAYDLFVKILENLPLIKFEILKQQEKVDILLVTKYFKEIWQEEISKYNHYKNIRNTKVLSAQEYFDKENNYTTRKDVYLLSLFYHGMNEYELVKKLSQSNHKIHLLLYASEIEIVEKLTLRYMRELTSEYQSADRFELTGIEYPKTEDDISGVIEKFYQIEDRDRGNYEYDQTEQIYYRLYFQNDFQSSILEGSKSVLLEKGQEKRIERASNLVAGDNVRIYDNSSKEHLFEIALSEDKEGRFSEIDNYSKIWKSCLKEYFELRVSNNPRYGLSNLMSELIINGSMFKSMSTLKKWLNENDKERFPASISNLLALKNAIKSQVLDANFEQIKKCRKLYRSIMISLGRDLSDEIMDYIISNSKVKGKILDKFSDEEIHSFVNQSAPLRTVKQINIVQGPDDEQ